MNKPTTQKDPRMEWGFYAMTPRIVRTKYKELSHTEKWLYTCLKDLCGKKGTCFRTLRSLKEETDISIASLSTMIPRLHDAGLIHAEKKRSPRSGKEIWHISIVDIWQMNKDYCSEIEQSQDAVVQNLNEDLEIVHSVNKVVQKTNKETGDCSNSERGCSNFSDIRIYTKNIDTEIESEEEEGTFPREDHDADTGSLHSPTPAHSPIAIDTPTHERGEQHGTGTRPTPGNLRPDLHGGAVAPGHDAPAGESRVPGGPFAAASAQRGDHPAQGTPERGRGKATRSDSVQPGDTSVAGSGGRIEKGEQHFSTGRNSFPQDSAKVEPKKQGSKDKKKSEEPEPIVLSPEAEKLWRAWCSLFTVEVKLIPANAKAAEELVKPARLWCSKLHWTLAEWLKALKDNAYATDTRGYYDRRGVKLFDIPRELEGWQSAKEHELAKLAQAAEPKSVTPPPMNPTLESLYRLRQQRMGVTS